MPKSKSSKFTIDHAGVQALLMSEEVRQFIDTKVDIVAASLEGVVTAKRNNGTEDEPVEIGTAHYTTDRAAGAVTIMHAAGVALEAKHGYLKKAAEAAGLEWGRKSPGASAGLLNYTTKAGTKRKATAAQIAHWTRAKK